MPILIDTESQSVGGMCAELPCAFFYIKHVLR